MPPALFLVPLLVVAAPDPIEPAREAVKRLEFAQAKTAIERVATADGLNAAQVAEYYELRGIVFGSLGDKAKARAAFLARLLLEPTFRLKGKVSPKVSTPYFEAKADAEERGGVTVKLEPGPSGKAKVLLSGGWSGLVKTVALTARDERGERPARLPAAAELVVDCAAQCTVAVELLGERDWQLLTSAAAPVTTVVSQASAPVTPVAPTPTPVKPADPAPPQPVLTQPAPTPAPAPARPRLTGLVVALGGAAVAAGVAGTVLGVSSAAAREKFNTATRDSKGVVTDLTRADALTLNEHAKSTALGANIAFGVAGALALGAAAVLIVDLTAAVAPTPGGAVAVVAGTF